MEQHQFGLREWAGLCERKDATIAALQARVKECDAVIEKQVAILEEINKLDAERAAFVVDLKAQLTQRTAELEAAKDKVQFLEKKNRNLLDSSNMVLKVKADQDVRLDDLQAELERVRGELAETKEVEAALSSKVAEYEVELNGDPQNFYGRGRTVGLRTLIAALPKVEGEIAVKETEIDLAVMWGITVNGLFGEHSPLFDTKEEADAYAALLQHRQGMEG